MNQASTLIFFRQLPTSLEANERLASSLQSLESSFFLLALGRFPHAFTVCVSSIESCLQASPAVGAGGNDGLSKLEPKAREASLAVSTLPSLSDLISLRNKITHRGFSPRDDSKSAALYIELALPFLCACFQEFHGFQLMDGLLVEYAEQLRVAQEVYRLAKGAQPDLSYCFRSFSHLLRSNLKDNFSADWELQAALHAEEIGHRFEVLRGQVKDLESSFEVSWRIDCPVCSDFDAAVVEIDADSFGGQRLTALGVCTAQAVGWRSLRSASPSWPTYSFATNSRPVRPKFVAITAISLTCPMPLPAPSVRSGDGSHQPRMCLEGSRQVTPRTTSVSVPGRTGGTAYLALDGLLKR